MVQELIPNPLPSFTPQNILKGLSIWLPARITAVSLYPQWNPIYICIYIYMAFFCRGYIFHPISHWIRGPIFNCRYQSFEARVNQRLNAAREDEAVETVVVWLRNGCISIRATCRQAHRVIQPFSNMKGCNPTTLPWKSKTIIDIIKELSPGSVDYKHNYGLYGKKHSKHSLWCLWTSRVEAIIRGGFYMLYSNLIRFSHIEICLLKLITWGVGYTVDGWNPAPVGRYLVYPSI